MAYNAYEELKAILTDTCMVLRDVQENAYSAHQMVWDMYAILNSGGEELPSFHERWESRDLEVTRRIRDERQKTTERLDRLIQHIQAMARVVDDSNDE